MLDITLRAKVSAKEPWQKASSLSNVCQNWNDWLIVIRLYLFFALEILEYKDEMNSLESVEEKLAQIT